MKGFKLVVPLMSFRWNPFEIQARRLHHKRFPRLPRVFDGAGLQNPPLPLIIILLLFSDFDTAFAQNNKNDSLIVGSAAPTFFLKTLTGEEFYLSNYCGKLREPWKNKKPHVVILSFFATWCAPCLQEIAVLEETAMKFAGQNLKIFLINVNEKPEIITRFAGKHQIKLPVLQDSYGLVAQKYGADKLPRYVLIDQDGKIALLGKGYTADFKEKLNQELSLLLGHLESREVRPAR